MPRLEAAQHMVEGTVFKHQHDDMLQLIKSWRHRAVPFVRSGGVVAVPESQIDSDSAATADRQINLNVWRQGTGDRPGIALIVIT